MTSVTGKPADAGPASSADSTRPRHVLDLSRIDLTARIHDKAFIERFIPHRGNMSLLDWIAWESDDFRKGVAVWEVRGDEFWVAGHFPSRPLVPGVLLVEGGAQLACYLYNRRLEVPTVVLFLRIEQAAFRASVEPGDTLHILCNELKAGRRRFSCEMQGIVGDKIAFDCTIVGLRSDEAGA